MTPDERAQKINEIRRAQQIAEIRGAGADPAQVNVASIGNPEGPQADIPVMRQASNALAGMSQGATLGYMPQMVGGLNAAGNFVMGKEPNYVGERDKEASLLEKAQKENPKLYGAGAMVGGLMNASTLAKALKAAGIANALTKMGAYGKFAGNSINAFMNTKSNALPIAMAAGGAYGAAANPGDKPGVVDPLQLDQRAENAETGELLGAAGHTIAPVVEAGGNALYNGTLNKLSAAIGKKGKTGITEDAFNGGIWNPKNLAQKTKALMQEKLAARDAIAKEATGAGAEMDVHNALEEAQAHVDDMKVKAGRDPDLLDEVSLAQNRIDRLRQNAAVEAKTKLVPSKAEGTYDAPTMGKIDRVGTPDPVVPNKFSEKGQNQKGISGTRPVINDAVDEVGSLPVGGTYETTPRLPGPNPIQARALTSSAQSRAGNSAYKEFAKSDNGQKLEKAIAAGFQKGNEASIERALGPEAAQAYAEHNAGIGRIIDSSKAAETVSDQTARDIHNLFSLPKTEGLLSSGVGTMVGASTHDPTSAVLSALAAVGGSKVMRAANLSQMPVGYAMKKAAPVIQKAIEKNPWLIQGMLNNQVGGPNGEK